MMSRTGRKAFTLIELLVVVAIIALLISILLPSLNKARDQAKAAVCSSRLTGFGRASAVYVQDYNAFTPVSPAPLMPQYSIPTDSSSDPRVPGSAASYDPLDPAVGWLVFYGMDFRPELPLSTYITPVRKEWENFPYGFRLQGLYEPDTLWEGFFCPSQNIRNTTDLSSPEIEVSGGGSGESLDVARHQAAGQQFIYAAAYMQNHLLRCGTPVQNSRYGGLRPLRPLGAKAQDIMWGDNCYPAVWAYMSHEGSETGYYVQAPHPDLVKNAADCVYLADSLDYKTHGSERVDDFSIGMNENNVSAGMMIGMHHQRAVVLGARHGGSANVLYVDGHVSRDGQTARNMRGDLTVAATFSAFVEKDGLGSQYKLLPTWRMLD